MEKEKTKNLGLLKKQDGFVSVMALMIIFALMIIGLKVQRTNINTINGIKANNNYIAAGNISYSAIEAFKFDLRNRESGYSKTINCDYVEGGGVANNSPECTDPGSPFSHLGPLTEQNENVKILFEVKGRSTDAEKISGPCTGSGFFPNECYTIPSPGSGNAGSSCKLYTPVYFPDTPNLPDNLANGATDLHQIDYSCNWNRLQFGSSATDRAVIPLYYDDGTEIVNPFQTPGNIFALRMRTPCRPCVFGADTPGWDERYCEAGADETVCAENERFVLDEGDGNDILVQWQIMGQCDDGGGGVEECGLVPFVKYDANGNEHDDFSGISERSLNRNNFLLVDSIILYSYRKGIDTNSYVDLIIDSKLQSMEAPRLTMFLTGKLISDNGRYIPYLEYQLLTNTPVANSILEITANVNVDGNSFDRIIYKNEESALIDFAIQN